MKQIIGDKVYIAKGTIKKLRWGMGLRIESPLVSSIMLSKIMGVFTEENGCFYWDRDLEFEFQPVIDEEAKEFVKNADWILDYEYLNDLSLDELKEEYNDIEEPYNELVKKINNMQNACDNKRKKEKIYKSFEPEILQAEFALEEIGDLYKKKEKEIELARIEQEEAQKREEIEVKKRTLKDIIRRAWNKKDNK